MRSLLFALLATGTSLAITPSAYANPLHDDLLDANKAFALTTQVVNANTVVARWKIAKGYYLYRNKFKFEALNDGVSLKDPVFPMGIRKHDEFLGDVVTYRNAVRVLLPVSRTDPSNRALKLQITAQGCADLGVCYPPVVETVDLRLPGIAQRREPAPIAEALANSQDFLNPNQAFRLQVDAADSHNLIAHIAIAPGYYLYRDKIHFKLASPQGASLAPYHLPRGQMKIDPFIGTTEIYHDPIDVNLSLQGDTANASTVELNAIYQGCAEKGICYPPITKTVTIQMPGTAAATISAPAAGSASDETSHHADLRTYLIAMLAAFGTGLLLTFTPCVLPMIPILSSVIVGQGDRHMTKLRGGLLSLSYVLGTAVTYTAAGVLAGKTGGELQSYFQNPYAIGLFSTIFVLLALSMFGFYELQVPSFIQSHLHHHSHQIHRKSHSLRGGAFFGTFALGLFSALIVGACVSPLLISALSIAISSRDPVLGAAIMFSIAMGMGVILIAIGVGAGFLLPKAGAWMDTVKHVFGVLLLGVSIYILSALPQVPVLLLWAALLIITAIYLGATQPLPKEAKGWQYLWKGVGTVFLVWGILALVGGLSGQRDILNPLPQGSLPGLGTQVAPTGPAATQGQLFRRYNRLSDIETAMAGARASGKPVLLDFYADWCTDCVLLERGTFSDPRVQAALQGYVRLQADVTDTDAQTQAIKQQFGVLGPPAILLFSADGREQKQLDFYGYRTVHDFLATLKQAAQETPGTEQAPTNAEGR